ncbi:hypothetical protein HDV00_012759, partial [Rhizophlyctis rosea]
IALLDPLAPHTSPNGSCIKLGHTSAHFDETAAQLEGFGRPLWGLASLLAGGGEYDGKERWARGLAAGTDPEAGAEFWGWVGDKDQRMVEMCPIGFALATAPSTFWDPLTPTQRTNLTTWLNAINTKSMPNTNWLWFRIFANLALRRLNEPHDAARMEADLNHLDTFYLGDGWSRDGAGGPDGERQLDYYSSSFAIHTAQLVYAQIAGDEDPKRAEEYRRRAREFGVQFIHYFDADGNAIPFGRSMVYRFAVIAFFSALAYSHSSPAHLSALPAPFTPGVLKGLIHRHLRTWTHHPSIFNTDGTLNIGYTYPNMYMTENYNSPGSVYWCCKAFFPLALPSDHPFWTSEEEPFPFPTPYTRALTLPGHIITHTPTHTFLLNSGQACEYPLKQTQAKYGKFAYSSAFGFSVSSGAYTAEQYALDSTLAVSLDDGETWYTRRLCKAAQIRNMELGNGGGELPILESEWEPVKGVTVRTWLIPPVAGRETHYRIHHITSSLSTKIKTWESAFALHSVDPRTGRAIKSPIKDNIGLEESKSLAVAASGKGVVGIRDAQNSLNTLLGGNLPTKRTGSVIAADPNTNVLYSKTVIPSLFGEIPPNQEAWYVTSILAIPSTANDGTTGIPAEKWSPEWEEAKTFPDLSDSSINAAKSFFASSMPSEYAKDAIPKSAPTIGYGTSEARFVAPAPDTNGMYGANTIRRALERKGYSVGAWVMLPGTSIARTMAGMGMDWILIDMEHGNMTDATLYDAVSSIAPWGVSPIVRLPTGDHWMLKRALDTGVHGVMIPMVNTKAQAEAIVQGAKFPPMGVRGHGSPFYTAAWRSTNAEYVTHANQETMVIVQIETVEAVRNVDEIAAVPGVDMLFIGPNDLAASLGRPPTSEDDHPDVVSLLEKVKAAAKRHNKLVGIWASDGAMAARRLKQGFQMVSVGADVMAVVGWYSKELQIAGSGRV